jgi:tetratricopeptide (TPR) repeat protein
MASVRALAVAALLLAASAEAAPPPWVEVKSAHFTVVTNAGDKAGRRTAWQFEQIRAALARLWPWAKVDSGLPFVIFAAHDEASLKTLGPQYWEGKRLRPGSFWVTGRDCMFVALRTDVREPDEAGSNPYQTAYWSYAHAVFTRSFPRVLPFWYSRGVAEVMSNTVVREKELHVGRVIQDNLKLMQSQGSIPLEEFLAADRRSHWLTQPDDAQIFDAQAWALVHYLMFGDEGRNSARVTRFNTLLYDGATQEAALKEAFGDMTPYYVETRRYVMRQVFSFSRVPVSLDTPSEGYTARPLSPGEAAVRRGELLAAMGRPVEARALAEEARKADPTLPGPWEIEGTLLDAEDRREDARAAFEKAAAAGSKKAYVHYRLAQLEWTPNPDRAARERLAERLEAARALDPDSANTLSFLAEVRSGLGDNEEALKLATRAVELDPSGTYHRMALAHALWSLGRSEDALRVARSALETATTDAERQRVQQFLDFASRTRP